MPQLRVGAMFQEQIGAFLVIEHAAEPVPVAGRREIGRDAGLADRVHVYTQLDHLGQQRIPSAVGRAKQSVFTERRFPFGFEAEIQQEIDRLPRVLFREQRFADAMILTRGGHDGGSVGGRGDFGIGAGGEENAHHLDVVHRGGE